VNAVQEQNETNASKPSHVIDFHHIDACMRGLRRLPIVIGDGVVRGIDRVDPCFTVSPRLLN
jgi:hypothetical protein